MYNILLILVKKRRNVPKCPLVHNAPAALHLPHGPGLPSNDVMEMSQNRWEKKHYLDLNKVLMTCHVKIYGLLHRI